MMNNNEEYFKAIDVETNKVLDVAKEARKKGFDPVDEVEVPLTRNLAERVEGLISVVAPQIKGSGVVQRINELEKKYGFQDWRVALSVALEVTQEKFCKFKDKREAMEVGIRVGFAYVTVGVVVSPLEGFVKLQINKRKDGGEYFCLFYSGPVRSAGGTAASSSVLIADYVRKKMGYKEYDPTEVEIKRTVTEVFDYHEKVTNLQYFPSEEEIIFLLKHLPVQINGDPSEKYEVSNYKDLERIETNIIRNGVALVIAECLSSKAPKILKQLQIFGKDFDLEHWNFLEKFVDMQKKLRAKKEITAQKDKLMPDYNYIHDLVAGRPVFTHPLAKGGFRLRYGRARNSGLSSQAVHPATMLVLENFIAVGTQLKVERPGKATVIASCDSIEGPIVKLNNGSVVFLESEEEAKKVVNDVEEVIYLGDLLINYGDFLNRAHVLVPVGYCEEWWKLEAGVDKDKVTIDEAIDLCKNGKPLHPRYCFHWSEINKDQFVSLINWLKKSSITDNKIILPYSYDVNKDLNEIEPKRIIELLGIPHKLVSNEHVVIENPWAKALMFSLGNRLEVTTNKENALDIVNEMSGVLIRDKSGTTIGARMGRPEKAKMRKLTGSPQILFPVGKEGGKMRCFQSCLEKGIITAEFAAFFCENCKKETVYRVCEFCGRKIKNNKSVIDYKKKALDINFYFKHALDIIKTKNYPNLIKGVRGTSNKSHITEHLVKGILRAMHNLYVNKDGTIRYDMTETCITHFTPKEIGTSINKLRELGYDKDYNGNDLANEDQILEIKVQDVILPSCDDSLDEKADDVIINVASFIDDCLEKLYSVKKFYNIKKREDVIGHLIMGMSPHTSAGVVGRIIGFSKTQGFYCHPYFHCLMRRDCVFPTTKFAYSDKNEKIFYEEIGSFVELLIKNKPKTKIVDAEGTLQVECDRDLYAYGCDPITKEIKKRKIKHFIKGPLTRYWVKVTTATNRNYIMTQTHDFMYLDEKNNFKFKKAKDIMVNDKILILDYFNPVINFNDKINLVQLFLENATYEVNRKIIIENCSIFFKALIRKIGRARFIKLMNFQSNLKKNLNRWYCGVPLVDYKKLLDFGFVTYDDLPKDAKLRYLFGHVQFNSRLLWNESLASLFGYYTAEGHMRENKTTKQISFRIMNKELQNKIIELIKRVFNIEPVLEENNTKITICHNFIYYLFKYCFKCGENAKSKHVPNLMYNAPDELVKSYISSYIDGDGSIILQRKAIVLYSVNRSLLDEIAFLLTRFNLIARYIENKPRLPGKALLDRYKILRKKPKLSIIHNLIYTGVDCRNLAKILKLNHFGKLEKINKVLDINTIEKRRLHFNKKQVDLYSFGDVFIDYIKSIEIINNSAHSYCLEIDWKTKEERNILWGQQIINTRCDGDEAGIILLMDVLLNFSRYYIPGHRGAKQDEPLVLSSKIIPSEVDDMVFDMDIVDHYPLELYLGALEFKYPWEVKIKKVKDVLNTPEEYQGFKFTHNTTSINSGVMCSSYKKIPLMMDKVEKQMKVAEKVRAVNESDVARLIIEKHFIRDLKGNLRKFSMQQFRCVDCNEKFRRPPLSGKCKCGGRIIFTISEGSVIKYLEPSLFLAEKYDLPAYLKQNLDLTKKRIESYFGKLEDKQEGLIKWFK